MLQYPKVTIAIPLYNAEKYVENCINSVINQIYQNIEILIVYDPSEDNSLNLTVSILQNCNRQYKIIEKSINEKGPGNSRNLIIDNFKGDYLYFLDSDDFITPDAIYTLVQEASLMSADIVAASHRVIDEEYKELNIFQYKSKLLFDLKSLKKYIYLDNNYYSVYSWNKLYKRSFILDNKLKYVHNFVEDAVFSFLEIQNISKIVLLPKITYNYINRSSSITNNLMYSNLSIEIAQIYLSIRNFIYKYNSNKNDIASICCNIDSFVFCYILTVRNTFISKLINKEDKLSICKEAFITPKIPITLLFKLIVKKKKSLTLLVLVKLMPYRVNVLLIEFYHKIKRK